MNPLSPDAQRRFAVDVVRTLRQAGHETYWAGGCVRDRLLGRTPADFDVATGATPDEVRRVFGHRRTLAIGAAFGVITVLGPPGAGPVEVATFRQDATYSDGRHPDHVTFSSAREDALRRDFTINGLFFDPLTDEVIDFVEGQADLAAGVIRAIGRPELRFEEDRLRMLRAVRFAATFGFELEEQTEAAIRQMAVGVTAVSAERIAGEIERMLALPARAQAVRLLLKTGLAEAVLPEIVDADVPTRPSRPSSLEVLDRIEEPTFALALAVLLGETAGPEAMAGVCCRWRLPNKVLERAVWLVGHRHALRDAMTCRWSALQPLLVSPGIGELLQWVEAEAAVAGQPAPEVDHCRTLLMQPAEKLDPPPLITGDDLVRHGLVPGPLFRRLLDEVRTAQLDSKIETSEEALTLVDRLCAEWDEGLGAGG
ncbi:MAG: CCA tRNA nucleotidyltransferase [Pirellulales bacterium]|nr:CCA tRNA nucleotidyltransferase [Pirellulales bacterium]